jgi:hypothetical protein
MRTALTVVAALLTGLAAIDATGRLSAGVAVVMAFATLALLLEDAKR